MEKVFKKDYAYFYDIFYKNKNYKKECLFLESIFRKFSIRKPLEILDIACGTGGHANNLAKMGYTVTGIDASEYMLKRAMEKAERESLNVKYFKMKMENFRLKDKFDVAISMFSTIDYLIENNQLEQFLRNVYRHLKSDSLFIFDFWNGVAVLKYYTPHKIRKMVYRDLIIKRESKTEIQPLDNLCKVNYKVRVFDRKRMRKTEFKESHLMRYFFIPELIFILNKCGFKTLGAFPFLSASRQLKPTDWDIAIVAKRFG